MEDCSVDLVVTSPPYPMIEMWDAMFEEMDPMTGRLLEAGLGKDAFERMHCVLDSVWDEVTRVLKPGGVCCINIGDATRSLGGSFSLYPSHYRITEYFYRKDFYSLPNILWRKQANSPAKYMGSGMLPVGAYVTLEHEYILIFRKGSKKRGFKTAEEKANRNASGFFWEERNQWFSDIWTDLKGVSQKLGGDSPRARSAAFPFELAYRLINMYSVKGDMVLDPFLGTGTTCLAAAVAGRNSLGFEIACEFRPLIEEKMSDIVERGNICIKDRLKKHAAFVEQQKAAGREFKYFNGHYQTPVISKQEVEINLGTLVSCSPVQDTSFVLRYED